MDPRPPSPDPARSGISRPVRATARLALRELTVADAAFVLELVNDPAWLRHIGDRGVRDLDDARAYIDQGLRASYARHGFGLWCVERRGAPEPLGLCGLLKRDTLEHADLGYAFLARCRGQGFALEAAAATLAHARDVLALPYLQAIVAPDNAASIALLGKLGFRFERMLPGAGAGTALYGRPL